MSVNEALLHVGQHDLPFGGVGASGMGHYHAREKATAGKSLAQTTDRRVAHVIGASDLGKHFSGFPASKGFPALMAG